MLKNKIKRGGGGGRHQKEARPSLSRCFLAFVFEEKKDLFAKRWFSKWWGKEGNKRDGDGGSYSVVLCTVKQVRFFSSAERVDNWRVRSLFVFTHFYFFILEMVMMRGESTTFPRCWPLIPTLSSAWKFWEFCFWKIHRNMSFSAKKTDDEIWPDTG